MKPPRGCEYIWEETRKREGETGWASQAQGIKPYLLIWEFSQIMQRLWLCLFSFSLSHSIVFFLILNKKYSHGYFLMPQFCGIEDSTTAQVGLWRRFFIKLLIVFFYVLCTFLYISVHTVFPLKLILGCYYEGDEEKYSSVSSFALVIHGYCSVLCSLILSVSVCQFLWVSVVIVHACCFWNPSQHISLNKWLESDILRA